MKKITFLFLVLAFGVFSIGWAQTTTFNFTGGVQTYTVPSGIFEVQIEALGGAGQDMTIEQFDPSIGGLGGQATGALAVTPGQVLNIFVGGAGIDGAGGYNGGGVGGFGTRSTAPMSGFAGSGGGASDVRVGGVTLADRVIVAGGGGGGGRDYVNGSCLPCGTGGNGGAGGALVGTNGMDAGPGNSSAGLYPHPDSGGSGGDQVMGGAGGMGTGPNGNPGILGVGGDGIDGTQSTASAGGGGGYYGGGAGSGSVGGSGTAGGGGAGGSSYLGGVTSGMTTGGVHSGDGQILITIPNSAPIAVCQDYTAQLDVNGSVTITGANVDGGSSDPDGDMFTLSVSPNTFDCSDIENIALDLTGGTSVGISTNANATIPTGNQARTLSVRINPATFSNSVGGIMHQGNLDCTGRMFGTGMNNSGFLFFWGGCNDYLSNLQLDLNVWQTVTVVYDGAGTVTLYKNGTSENYASGTLFTQLSRLFVGVETINNGASYRNFVDAQYSDIKVFDRALTPTEVGTLVAGNDVALGNLVLDIPVDEGTGMALSDNVGTNDATAFGTTESDWIVFNDPQTVTLTVTDVNGNSSTCTAEVTIEDSIAPVITCVASAPRDTDMGVCTYTVVGAEFDATYTDNCMSMSASITNDFNMSATLNGAVLPLGANVITWTVDDGNGQMATCATTITVEDNEAPVITCVADAPRDTDMGICTYTVVGAEFDPMFSDNCMSATISNDFNMSATLDGAVLPLGANVVTWTVDDGNGQTAMCTTTVTVSDNEAPVITCVADAPRDTDMGVCTYIIVGTEFDATFTDNCMTTTITNDLTGTATIAGEVLPLGDTVVTWTADDGNGQMAVCTTTITVEDNEAPSFMCVAPFVVMLDENGEASIDELDIIGGTLTITSVSGNNGSGSFGTTDFTAPVLTDVTVAFDWAYSTTDGPFWDNFGYIVNGVYTQLSTSSGNPQSGSASVALLAGDVFGFRSRTVDNIAGASTTEVSNFTPGFTGQFAEDNWTLALSNSDGTAFFNGTPNVTDNCGVDSYSLDVYDFTCADLGDNLVTFTATDVNGNTTSCTTTVTVEDNLGVVVISGPIDIFTGTGPSDGDCETTINYGVIDINSFVIEDNCGDASTTTVVQTGGLGTGASFPVGVTAEEFTLTDNNGNETIYIFNITITDTTEPVVDCPGDLIVSDGGTGVYTIEDYTATVSDNCSSGADLVVTQDPAAGTEVANGSTTAVTVTATDAAGNVTTCEFDILVDSTLSVEDTLFNEASISMYPNPTVGELNILAGNTTIDKVEVYDLAGRLVKRVSFDTTTYQFNLNDMDAAVYLVQIFSGSNMVVKRVIKK